MFTVEDVDMIKRELPTAAVIDIKKLTNISIPTIYRFLNGGKIRSDSQNKIYLAALKIIAKDKAKTNKIKEKRSQILLPA